MSGGGIWYVGNGGTGLSTLPFGRVFIGNGTSFDTTKPAPTGSFVGDTDTQTLTNKTLTAPTINGGTISGASISLSSPLPIGSGGTGLSSLGASAFLTSDGSGANVLTTKAVPSGSVVGTTDSQTLTNKTLTAPVISTISNTGTLTLPTSTDTLVGRATTDTLTNKTLTSPTIATILNVGTLTLPTSTDTLVGRDTTDTLTNKTLTSPTINGGTINGASITFGSPLPISSGGTGLSSLGGSAFLTSDGTGDNILTTKAVPTGTVVGTTDSQTLTNKTLTAPVISTISNTGTLTLPTSTDTLVGRDTTDTLTNKTLTSPTINGGTINGASITFGSPLDVSSGGTGASSLSSGAVLQGNGTSAITASNTLGAITTTSLTNATYITSGNETHTIGPSGQFRVYTNAAGSASIGLGRNSTTDCVIAIANSNNDWVTGTVARDIAIQPQVNTQRIFLGVNANVYANFSSTAATISPSTASTSTTTGALIVTGGVGIGGNLNVGGNIISTGNSDIYGDGSDADPNLVGGTTTLTRNMYYANLTMSSSAILNTAGFMIFVKGTLTMTGSSVIRNNGANATTVTGGAGGTAGILGGGGTGATSPAGSANGNGGGATTASYGGGAGGGGGADGAVPNTGGAGGSATSVVVNNGGTNIHRTIDHKRGRDFANNQLTGGGGGGSGATSDPGNRGGGGGGGGGLVFVFARVISMTSSSITANGGNGANGTGTGGGGGGGGGGAVVIISSTDTTSFTITASGGTQGTSPGGGVSGVVGSAGNVFRIILPC